MAKKSKEYGLGDSSIAAQRVVGEQDDISEEFKKGIASYRDRGPKEAWAIAEIARIFFVDKKIREITQESGDGTIDPELLNTEELLKDGEGNTVDISLEDIFDSLGSYNYELFTEKRQNTHQYDSISNEPEIPNVRDLIVGKYGKEEAIALLDALVTLGFISDKDRSFVIKDLKKASKVSDTRGHIAHPLKAHKALGFFGIGGELVENPQNAFEDAITENAYRHEADKRYLEKINNLRQAIKALEAVITPTAIKDRLILNASGLSSEDVPQEIRIPKILTVTELKRPGNSPFVIIGVINEKGDKGRKVAKGPRNDIWEAYIKLAKELAHKKEETADKIHGDKKAAATFEIDVEISDIITELQRELAILEGLRKEATAEALETLNKNKQL